MFKDIKMSTVIILAFIGYSDNSQSQIISQFSWDSNLVTQADVGPDATSVSNSAYSDANGVGGTNGLNAGTPKNDIDLVIPGAYFDVSGIDVSIDYQRDESQGDFVTRGNSLIMSGGNKFSVSYRVNDGAGSYFTVNSGEVYTIPNDDVFRTYQFTYSASTGVGTMLVDGVEVWSNDGPDGHEMYWDGSGDLIVAHNLDGNGHNHTFMDNLTIENFYYTSLPIELTSFEASATPSNYVQLDWVTASEVNNDYFVIERSKEGDDFEIIDTISGAGNSSESISYTYIDKSPYNGTSYYRLKQVDFDGESEIFDPISIKMSTIEEDYQLTLYPNPSIGNKVTLSTSNSNFTSVVVYNQYSQDVSSRLIIIQSDSKTLIINISELDKGIYFIKTNLGISRLMVVN